MEASTVKTKRAHNIQKKTNAILKIMAHGHFSLRVLDSTLTPKHLSLGVSGSNRTPELLSLGGSDSNLTPELLSLRVSDSKHKHIQLH